MNQMLAGAKAAGGSSIIGKSLYSLLCYHSYTSLIVTCLDPRCVPEDFFGFQGGLYFLHPVRVFAYRNLSSDGTGVLRNAGGRAAPALSDIVALHALFHLKNVVILHHTGKSQFLESISHMWTKTVCSKIVECQRLQMKRSKKSRKRNPLKQQLRLML